MWHVDLQRGELPRGRVCGKWSCKGKDYLGELTSKEWKRSEHARGWEAMEPLNG